MLSFELKRSPSEGSPEELEIYCDIGGLESLLVQLQFIKEGRTEHAHLMAESWGGTHLDDQPQDPNHLPLRHVKVIFRDNGDA
jgi:hypothetical protein